MPASQAELRWNNLVRQVIYVLVAAGVIIPSLIKLTLPEFQPSPEAKMLFDHVEALPAGSRVLIAFDFDPASEAELRPMGRVILRHCFRNDLVPILMTTWPSGVSLCRKICDAAASESKELWGKEKLSGRDYVFLGFRPGGANLLLNMGEDLRGAFTKDFYGMPTGEMAALADIYTLKDIDLAIDLAAGATVDGMWIPYGADRFGFPLGAGVTAVMAPDMYPYLDSGQIVGLLGGLRGAADYEVLLDKIGSGVRGMHAQSVTHLLLIVLLVVANIGFLVKRVRGKREG